MLAGLLSASLLNPAAEKIPPVKGTHVVITAPAGFTVAERFPGYQSEETGASIMVFSNVLG